MTSRELLLSAGVSLASMSSILQAAAATPRALRNGVDISWLPDVEAAGGHFFTSTGKRIGAISLLKSMVHLECGGDANRIHWWLDNATAYGLTNFDVIGMSYYSQWQGSLANLGQALAVVTTEFKKPVVIAETAYPWIAKPFGNDVLDIEKWKLDGFSVSPAGQQKFVKSLAEMLRQQPNNLGLGMWWWEGLATAVRTTSGVDLWNGGMANSALVDLTGKALPALKSLGA